MRPLSALPCNAPLRRRADEPHLACAACAQGFSAGARPRRADPGPRGLPRRGRPSRAPTARAAQPTVRAALQRPAAQRADHAGRCTQNYTGAYSAAKRSLGRLSGTRRAELGAVMGNVAGDGRRRLLHASRLPVIFLTLERNRQWWTTEPLLRQRRARELPRLASSCGSTTPGRASRSSGSARSARATATTSRATKTPTCASCVAEVLPLATKRAGGIAWEYMFPFDGGAPAVDERALAGHRAAGARALVAALQGTRLLTRRAAGARHLPDAAVQRRAGARRPAGAQYAEYTYAPSDRILNGFIQAVVGLYDYTRSPRTRSG